jgi:cobaltochelatase CobS
MYRLRETFNLPDVPEAAEIPGFEPGLPGVPKVKPYVFDKERLRQLTMFYIGGFRALMLEGDPSAGKTSFVDQFHARMNIPLHKVPCSASTTAQQLIGQFLPNPETGKLVWIPGPVTRAALDGTSVLLDEWNLVDPGEAGGVNMLLEGYSWTIPETGEIIVPKRTTRFFATQNAADSKALVAGRNLHDVASEDRWSYMEVDFLDPVLEQNLIVNELVEGRIPQQLATHFAQICVQVANKVRRAFRGEDETNPQLAALADAIDKPLSTRAVLRWAKYAVMYTGVFKANKEQRSGLHYGLRQAVRMSPTMAKAVNDMITIVAGFDERTAS